MQIACNSLSYTLFDSVLLCLYLSVSFDLLESKNYCVSMSYECTLTIRGCNKGGCDKQT